MTSFQAYSVSSKLNQMASSIDDIASTLESAKIAVNMNQLGDIPESITNSINPQIALLKNAQASLQEASIVARNYANQLKAEELRGQQELENAKNNSRNTKKSVKNVKSINTRIDQIM